MKDYSATTGTATCRPSIAKHEYEHTPPELAQWLVDLAERCKRHNKGLGVWFRSEKDYEQSDLLDRARQAGRIGAA